MVVGKFKLKFEDRVFRVEVDESLVGFSCVRKDGANNVNVAKEWIV